MMSQTEVNEARSRQVFFSPAITGLIVFGTFGLSILALSWHKFSAMGIEGGDFAANSILIQDAKHFKLIVGNYSRVGFNHPGPAILYVLAAGEAAFHDWLGWLAPIVGQMIAAIFYNAAWLGLAAFVLRQMRLSIRAVITIVWLSASLIAFKQPVAFSSLWFPYLYVLPFLTFVVASGGAVFGIPSAWIVLALSGGVLVNGHVSFVVICGIAAISVTLYAITFRILPPINWLVAAALTFSVFLLPLAIREVIFHPGPVEQYVSFAGSHVSNNVRDSLQFVGHQVASTSIGFAVFVIATILFVHRIGECFHRSIAFALITTSIGVLYYVIRGVDNLDYDYVIIFFCTVPVLLVSIAANDLIALSRSSILKNIILSGVVWAWAIPVYQSQMNYNEANVANIDRDLSSTFSRKVSFVLVGDHAWEKVWPNIVAVEARRIRDRRPVGFCIKNWHILFTDAAKCGAEDAGNIELWVDEAGASRGRELSLVLNSGGLDFFRLNLECLKPGNSLKMSSDPISMENIIKDGWSPPEGAFVWSVGKHAGLEFCVDQNVHGIELDVQAFISKVGPKQVVGIRVDGNESAAEDFDAAHQRQRLKVSLPISHSPKISVSLSLPNAHSPAQAGLSKDRRMLGVALYGLSAF